MHDVAFDSASPLLAMSRLDYSRAIVSYADGTIRVIYIEDKKEVAVFATDYPVRALAVMADRRTIVVGDSQGMVHFFLLEE